MSGPITVTLPTVPTPSRVPVAPTCGFPCPVSALADTQVHTLIFGFCFSGYARALPVVHGVLVSTGAVTWCNSCTAVRARYTGGQCRALAGVKVVAAVGSVGSWPPSTRPGRSGSRRDLVTGRQPESLEVQEVCRFRSWSGSRAVPDPACRIPGAERLAGGELVAVAGVPSPRFWL